MITKTKYVPKKKLKEVKESNAILLYLLPILFVVAIVPLMVFMKEEKISGIVKDNWRGGEINLDFFCYYKYIWISICGFAAITILLVRSFINDIKIKKEKLFVPLGIYFVLIIASSLASKYQDVVLGGFLDRHEGMLALVSYLFLMFVTFNFVNSEKSAKYVLYAFVFSATVIGLIGLSQITGHDFFSTNIGRQLIVMFSNHKEMASKLTFTFGNNRVYDTLFNPNYVGSYVVLLLPVLVGLAIYIKKVYFKVFFWILTVLMLINTIGSQSRAGFGGIVLAITLLIVLFRENIIRNIKLISIILLSMVILFVGFEALTGWGITNKIKGIEASIRQGLKLQVDQTYIKSITADKNILTIATKKGSILLALKNNQIGFFDEKGKPLEKKVTSNVISFTDNRFSNLTFSIMEKERAIKVCYGEKLFYLLIDNNNNFKVLGIQGKPLEIVDVDKFGFIGNEKFFDCRGYIWSRTIPMLKNSLILGYGPDVYTIAFPQNDIAGKLNTFGMTSQIVDKSHNLYLGIAVSSGVLSLIAFLALLGMYVYNSVKLYIRGELNGFKQIIGASILVSIIGYCAVGMLNDSVVSVAPLFWVLLGLGFSCNKMAKVSMQKDLLTK